MKEYLTYDPERGCGLKNTR